MTIEYRPDGIYRVAPDGREWRLLGVREVLFEAASVPVDAGRYDPVMCGWWIYQGF